MKKKKKTYVFPAQTAGLGRGNCRFVRAKVGVEKIKISLPIFESYIENVYLSQIRTSICRTYEFTIKQL